jgi:hypothetical protein
LARAILFSSRRAIKKMSRPLAEAGSSKGPVGSGGVGDGHRALSDVPKD